MKNYKLVMAFLLAFAVFIGCEEILDTDGMEENKAGSVIVKITDAPFPSDLVAEANVKIEGLKLKKVTHSEEEEDNDSVFLLMEKDTILNLLDLRNGITAILAQMEIPVGEYNEIRLKVVEANVVLTEGDKFDVKIPSGNSSGLKVKIKPALFIAQSADSELLLDFDVSRSFKTIGNIKNKHGIKGFHFKPVIRAVSQVSTGQISGEVSNESYEKIEGAYIALLQGTDTISTAITDDKGDYKMIGIPENEYTLVCEKEGFITDSKTVQVLVGIKTKQDFVLVAED